MTSQYLTDEEIISNMAKALRDLKADSLENERHRLAAYAYHNIPKDALLFDDEALRLERTRRGVFARAMS